MVPSRTVPSSASPGATSFPFGEGCRTNHVTTWSLIEATIRDTSYLDSRTRNRSKKNSIPLEEYTKEDTNCPFVSIMLDGDLLPPSASMTAKSALEISTAVQVVILGLYSSSTWGDDSDERSAFSCHCPTSRHRLEFGSAHVLAR